MTTIMMAEILSEKTALNKTYLENLELTNQLSKRIKAINPRKIIIFSRGSSRNAALYFKYLCEIDLGIFVQIVNPSVITVYNGKLSFKDSVVIAVSQGGRGEDLNLLMAKAKSEKAFTIALTNFPKSPLALKADYHLHLAVGEEKSIAATKTFTAELLLLLMIIDAFKAEKQLDMIVLDKLFMEVYSLDKEIEKIAKKYKSTSNLFVFSRGISLAIAKELECKLQESCFVNAHAFATSDFRHGPIALVQKGVEGIIIAAEDETEKDSYNFIKQIKSLGITLMIITDSPLLFKEVKNGFLLPKSNRYIFVLLATLTAQLFTAHLAEIKGINPDKSRNLEKYVMTK